MQDRLDEVISSSPVIVHRGRYAYLKGQEKALGEHFLVSQDRDEITIVTEERNISKVRFEQEEKWFRLFEIKTSTPFQAPGFIAKISKAIADKGLNILVVSTFSKDYILIREEKYKIAIEALKGIGFPVIEE